MPGLDIFSKLLDLPTMILVGLRAPKSVDSKMILGSWVTHRGNAQKDAFSTNVEASLKKLTSPQAEDAGNNA